MLKAEDYKKYDLRPEYGRRVMQISNMYLSKWGRIETNITELNEREREIAKRLFAALKHLTVEEREFLADKYRINPIDGSPEKAINDHEMAKKYKMPLKKYRKLRTALQLKLFYYLKDDVEGLERRELK